MNSAHNSKGTAVFKARDRDSRSFIAQTMAKGLENSSDFYYEKDTLLKKSFNVHLSSSKKNK